jgi:GNAT superfamily N-acetyltransferase
VHPRLDNRSALDTVEFLTRPAEHADALALLGDRLAEWEAAYGYGDPPDVGADDYLPPHGLFLVGYDPDGEAVACGGYRLHDQSTMTFEIKRMYVRPDWRGRGLGRRLLELLESEAGAAGAARLILETGSVNVPAQSLYTTSGYDPIPSYVAGRDPSTNRAFVKSL